MPGAAQRAPAALARLGHAAQSACGRLGGGVPGVAGSPGPAGLGGRAWAAAAAPAGGTGAGGQALLLALRAAAARGLSSAASAAGPGAQRQQRRGGARRLRALLRDYKQLSKFRLSALVALTASAGFAAGSGESVDLAKLGWASAGTLAAAACANTLNQLYEVANDGRMARTAARPLPAGRLGTRHAAAFALLTGAAGLWMLAEKTNGLTAGLGAANILLYAGVYTPLKQLSIYNTWVGAVVGAIPPLMGWAAAAGELEPGAWVLAAALFSWQMPHFMALAWMCQDDYARGGFRMLPSVDPRGRRTAAVALRHCALLAPLGAVAVALHMASPWFAGEAALLAAAMGAGALSFRAQPTAQSARKLFRGSLVYLPLLLAGLAAHRLPNRHETSWADVRQAAERRLSEADAALPPALRPGRLWVQLQELQAQLHWPKLRPVEERYALVLEVQRQVLKCPSKVYGDTAEGAAAAAADGSAAAVAAAEADSMAEAAAAAAAAAAGNVQQESGRGWWWR